MARVLYLYRHMSEYIQIDLDLLRERHAVTVVECASRWPRPLLLVRLVTQADLVASWFASWHSFVPAVLCRMLGKPFVISTGGYDTARLHGIGYGHQRGGLKRFVALTTMRLADRLIVVSEASRLEVLKLGVPASKVTLCSHGLDPARYPVSTFPRKDMVVTVCGVNRSNLRRKGLEAFVRTAEHCPHLRFVVVGAWMDDTIARLRAIAHPNVCFTGWVSHDEKVAWLSRAWVIMQPSIHEAFGLSVAEGMLCGAVPVVTVNGALPELVGDCGVLVGSQDPKDLAEGVRRALALGQAAGARARTRVLERFTLDHRRRALESVICGELDHLRDSVLPNPPDLGPNGVTETRR